MTNQSMKNIMTIICLFYANISICQINDWIYYDHVIFLCDTTFYETSDSIYIIAPSCQNAYNPLDVSTYGMPVKLVYKENKIDKRGVFTIYWRIAVDNFLYTLYSDSLVIDTQFETFNRVVDGKYISYSDSKKVKVVAYFQKGLLHGSYYYYDNKKNYREEVSYTKGKKDGYEKCFFYSKNIYTLQRYKHGKEKGSVNSYPLY